MPQPTATITYLVSYNRATIFGMTKYDAPSYGDVAFTGNPYYADLPAPGNGHLDFWCLNPTVTIPQSTNSSGIDTGITLNATLYSSYELHLLPSAITAQIDEGNLAKVNWILNQDFTANNQTQYNYGEVQAAIWVLMGSPYSVTDPTLTAAGPVLVGDVNQILADAATHGNFVPNETQYMAVVIDPTDLGGTVHYQPSITVVKAAKLGDFVWEDNNRNGTQEAGELGINGITVNLWRDLNGNGRFDGGPELLATTITASAPGRDDGTTPGNEAQGYYEFNGLMPGADYQVEFVLPSSYQFTLANTGAPDTVDSDAVVTAAGTSGYSQVVVLSAGEWNRTVDAGIYQEASLGNKVWLDCDEDGGQDAGELPVVGAKVVLIGGGADGKIGTGGDDTTTTTYTDGNGEYTFVGLTPGAEYQVQFTPLAGYHFTTKDAPAATDATDSDANTAGPDVGKSQIVTLASGEYNDTIDAGIVSDCRLVTFDFSGDSCTDGDNGNVRTYTDALTGVSVTARAFSQNKTSGDSGTTWQSAWLGAYSGGLGVTDNSEGSGGGDSHTIDNVYRNNYVVLQFSQEVKIDKAYLGYVVCDSDIQVWIGNSASTITSMSGTTLSDLVAPGTGGVTETNTTTSSAVRWADINAGGVSGNTLIISADTTDLTPEDRFKLEKLVLCAPDCGPPVAKACIGNFVWEDMDYDGVQDTGELGIAGVTVKLLNGDGTKVLATTTTDANGGYSFKTLDPGDYKIQVVKPSGYYVTKQDQSDDTKDSDISSSGYTQKYTLAAGECNDTADAGLYRKAYVGDKVWDDMDHDNVQDANEPGIAGIKVKLLSASGATLASTTTDQYGNYKFTVNPGTYQLQFDKTDVQHYNYGQWNNMSYWKWAKPDQGGNDAKDSDVVGNATATTNVTKTVTPFTLVSGQSDMTRDAGITPIVIDLDGGGIQTVSRAQAGGAFDLFGNGSAVKSGWIASGEGFLAVDRDGNGRIDSISELFGGTAKGAGFARLAEYDSNDDGLVNASDAGFIDLRVWRDANGNHQTDDGELMSLSEAGVSELTVGFVDLPFLDRQGNIHLERSSARMSDGSSVDMTDVYFNVAADDAAAAGVDLSGIDQLLGTQQAAATVDAGWLFV
ncbi:MAG: carboxypeptidase regulatory-like domain-containing protein [Candidatus Accumulibacter sp.]|uniref:SdrD B-like domain-containing protein n=1 Tax=Accumulibacter sp. TaxID=2053492 RepID=UPI001B0F1435|nr:SdrD B-like domain-containing protein [Accumulibacter sp.]MBO3712612.1 carboxypeptidase regulatory-like domain-containing protein [Accumulibacter sp.]